MKKSNKLFLSADSFFLIPSELKDNLGNDEPEGDMPVLLQTLLSRNPKIFRDKSRLKHTALARLRHFRFIWALVMANIMHRLCKEMCAR